MACTPVEPSHSTVDAAAVVAALFPPGAAAADGITAPRPISVYLPVSNVHVTAAQSPFVFPSRSARPARPPWCPFSACPRGVTVTYAASDTNPSGSLTFAANPAAMTGSLCRPCS